MPKVEEINKKQENITEKTKNWQEIHPDFGKNVYGKTYQERWEEMGFTKEEAKEWIENSFELGDWPYAESWKKQGFTPSQAGEWLKVGLKIKNDYENGEFFAAFLRDNGYSPITTNVKELKKQAQIYLDFHWPKEKKEEATSMGIGAFDKNLEGSLIIDNWPKLEDASVFDNKLSFLQLSNCPQLTYVRFDENHLTSISIKNCPKISHLGICNNLLTDLELSHCFSLVNLDCSNNQLSNANFLTTLPHPEKLTWLILSNNKIKADLTILSKFTGLEHLQIDNNPYFCGSLEYLKEIKKLKVMYIDNTGINFGLEYLPESLGKIYCNSWNLVEKMKDYVKLEWSSGGKTTFYCDYQTWKKNLAIEESEKIESQTDLIYKEKQLEEGNFQKQLIEIAEIITPNKEFDFTELKEEAKKLKIESLTYNLKIKKLRLKYSINNLVNNLELDKDSQKWLETTLKIQETSTQNRAKENLKKKLSEKEIQKLLDNQTEINAMEKQLELLQEIQEAQIQIPPK